MKSLCLQLIENLMSREFFTDHDLELLERENGLGHSKTPVLPEHEEIWEAEGQRFALRRQSEGTLKLYPLMQRKPSDLKMVVFKHVVTTDPDARGELERALRALNDRWFPIEGRTNALTELLDRLSNRSKSAATCWSRTLGSCILPSDHEKYLEHFQRIARAEMAIVEARDERLKAGLAAYYEAQRTKS